MAVKEVVHCDGCGEAKKDTNHWFVLLTGQTVLPAALNWHPSSDATIKAFAFARMSEVPSEHIRGLRHYCGQSCLSKVFQQWMDSGEIPEV